MCQKDSYLQELIRYIHLNPLRAKLSKDLSAWKWSSHREYLGEVKTALTENRFALSLFHKEIGPSRRLYGQFLREGIGTGHQEEFYPSPSTPCLGEPSFIEDYRERVSEKTIGHGGAAKLLPLERLALGSKRKLSVELLCSPSQARKVTAARHAFVLSALKLGHRPSQIAAFLRCSPSAISKIIARGL